MAGKSRSMLLVAALLLAGVWAWQRWRPHEDANTARSPPVPARLSETIGGGLVAPPPAPVGRIPGELPPSIESATPAEIAALRQAEVARSAGSAPIASWKGPDGRQHAFAYRTLPADEAQQHAIDARREDLMRELRADPAGFARRNGLSPREAERILDGTIELPDRLLD